MKTVWIVLAVLAGLGLLCCRGVLFVGRNVYQGVVDANDQADRYAKDVFRKAATNWNVEGFLPEASPELLQTVTEQGLKLQFQTYKEKYGAFNSVSDFTANSTSVNNNNGVSETIVKTRASANFDKDTAQVLMEVVKKGDQWKVKSISLI